MELASPSKKLSEILSESVDVLSSAAQSLDKSKLDGSVEKDLTKLQALWQFLKDVLSSNFDDNCSPAELLDRFEWMQKSKKQFYMLCQEVANFDSKLEELLEIIEHNLTNGFNRENPELLFDSFEGCWSSLESFKPVLISSKAIFEAGLEFNEILNDHLGSLDMLVDETIEKCAEIRRRTSLTNFHYGDFDKPKRVSTILLASADTGFSTLPSFPHDEGTIDSFIAVGESMNLLEGNLRLVPSTKIKTFTGREICNKEFLAKILHQKHHTISLKYEALVAAYVSLKNDLVDTRWKLMFEVLNDSIAHDIKQVQNILLESHRIAMHANNAEKILALSSTIEKNFNIIYQALSSSILTIEITEKANELAFQWLALKSEIDVLDLKEDRDKELASGLRRLSLKSTGSEDSKRSEPQSKGVGAFLLHRMNIKPVIIQNTPMSVEKRNSPYANRNEPQLKTIKNFDVPVLKLPEVLAGSENESKEMSVEFSFRELLSRINFFSRRQSGLPIYQDRKSGYRSSLCAKLNSPMRIKLKSNNQSFIRHGRIAYCVKIT
ncbi:LAQU0S03e09846g1_1 [Lachancea quebecensis]|uniref:LAQU0S03e09846g1_1 n=1 Tax=Lachancea quebecensis TaxID=1654605 RepID=A0A0P1KS30_9SACH|nr:LAQU0S03e09846g1_1 [Lachancea quebecensis]